MKNTVVRLRMHGPVSPPRNSSPPEAGANEQFVEPHQGKLYENLGSTVDHFETPCGAYAAAKLDRYLLRLTGDPQYGDHLERVIYNTVLGVKQPGSDGDYPYYSTYGPRANKVWYPRKWPCCSGTLVQGVADYVLNLYFRAADGVTVNLCVPSELRFEQDGASLKLKQATDFPTSETISISIETNTPQLWTMRLRIPGWLKQHARITVNGVAVAPGQRRSFAAKRRRWKGGDVVELHLPQEFRGEPIDDLHPDFVARMRGPLMLVALDPPDGLEKRPLPIHQGFTALGQGADAWTRNDGGQEIVFVPFHQIQNEQYTTYFTRA
jgi:hypothetical protein